GPVGTDGSGKPLSQLAAGTLLLGIASAAAEELAPVPLLALLKHPLVGGEGEERAEWLDSGRSLGRVVREGARVFVRSRALVLCLRGPRPPAGLAGLDGFFTEKGGMRPWSLVRDRIA